MHAEARHFVERLLVAELPRITARRVLDVGGRDVNGSLRDLFPRAAVFDVLDMVPGDNVTIVADAATWEPPVDPPVYDLVISTETFEHTEQWREIVGVMAKALAGGGCMIVTAACDPREPHSAVDGWDLREGEWYRNVDPDELYRVMAAVLRDVTVRCHPRGDVYAYGFKL